MKIDQALRELGVRPDTLTPEEIATLDRDNRLGGDPETHVEL